MADQSDNLQPTIGELRGFSPGTIGGLSNLIMRSHTVLSAVLWCVLSPALSWAQAQLENPAHHSRVSGLRVISGWACQAETVTIRVNGGPAMRMFYGSERMDTLAVCGHHRTGFFFMVNWNLYDRGEHRVELLVDGVVAGVHTITVQHYGEEFMRGVEGSWRVEWPEPGTWTTFAWNEASQNVEIVAVEYQEAPEPEPDPPALAALRGRWHLRVPTFEVVRSWRVDTLVGTRSFQGSQTTESGDTITHTGGYLEDLNPRLVEAYGYDFYFSLEVTGAPYISCTIYIFSFVEQTTTEGMAWYYHNTGGRACGTGGTPRPASATVSR